MKIYLAGHNVHLKHAAALFLRASVLLDRDGHTVLPTPEQVDAIPNKVTFPTDTDGTYDYRGDLGRDLAWICEEADAVLLLPDWRPVARARAVVAAASTLRLPVYELTEYLLYGDRAERIDN